MQLGSPPHSVNTLSTNIRFPPQYEFPDMLLLQMEAIVLLAPKQQILLSSTTQSLVPGRALVVQRPTQPKGQLYQLAVVAQEPDPVGEPVL
jgi:hypothetical protein